MFKTKCLFGYLRSISVLNLIYRPPSNPWMNAFTVFFTECCYTYIHSVHSLGTFRYEIPGNIATYEPSQCPITSTNGFATLAESMPYTTNQIYWKLIQSNFILGSKPSQFRKVFLDVRSNTDKQHFYIYYQPVSSLIMK